MNEQFTTLVMIAGGHAQAIAFESRPRGVTVTCLLPTNVCSICCILAARSFVPRQLERSCYSIAIKEIARFAGSAFSPCAFERRCGKRGREGWAGLGRK